MAAGAPNLPGTVMPKQTWQVQDQSILTLPPNKRMHWDKEKEDIRLACRHPSYHVITLCLAKELFIICLHNS